jgi:hypothetical protein
MEAYRRSRGIAPLIPNLDTRWKVTGQLHAPDALPRYAFKRKMGGPQNWSGRFGEEISF